MTVDSLPKTDLSLAVNRRMIDCFTGLLTTLTQLCTFALTALLLDRILTSSTLILFITTLNI